MILVPTTTLHWLQGTDPADGYEDEGVVWSDRAQTPAHVDFTKSTRIVGDGSVQWVTTTRFQSDNPPVAFDIHWRVKDETTGATYQLVDFDYAPLFDAVSGTLQQIVGVA